MKKLKILIFSICYNPMQSKSESEQKHAALLAEQRELDQQEQVLAAELKMLRKKKRAIQARLEVTAQKKKAMEVGDKPSEFDPSLYVCHYCGEDFHPSTDYAIVTELDSGPRHYRCETCNYRKKNEERDW